jgi:hypothetical protein
MAKIAPYLLNLAGEYRVCSELNKRGVFATVTYGNRKGADVYAISERKGKSLKIEVKTTQNDKFVTRIGQKEWMHDIDIAPDFWVLFQTQAKSDGTFTDSFFVLSHKEICEVQVARTEKYNAKYLAKHGTAFDAKNGVDNVRVLDVIKYAEQWGKIVDRIGNP